MNKMKLHKENLVYNELGSIIAKDRVDLLTNSVIDMFIKSGLHERSLGENENVIKGNYVTSCRCTEETLYKTWIGIFVELDESDNFYLSFDRGDMNDRWSEDKSYYIIAVEKCTECGFYSLDYFDTEI